MKVIASIFWNTSQNRLRAGWRLLIQLILFLLITVTRDALASIFRPAPLPITITYLIYLVACLGLAWFMARFIDRRSFADFGFHLDRKWWLDIGFGLVLGAFLMTGIFLSMRVAGWVSITGMAITNTGLPFSLAFLLRVVLFAAVAVSEELTFRSYEMKNLAEGFASKHIGSRGALVLALLPSSVLFGIAHAANENATAFSTFALVLGGLLLALPYLLTGEIGISIGLHLTVNLFEGNVYGFATSGSVLPTRLFSIQQTGPSLWTGGSFGPEAGLVGLVWVLIGCGLTIWWIKELRKQVALYTPLATYTPIHNNL